MTKQKEQLREKVENLIYYGTDGFFMKDQTVSQIIKLLKDQREEILTTLHRIRANIPLTEGMASRKQMRELIDKLTKEND